MRVAQPDAFKHVHRLQKMSTEALLVELDRRTGPRTRRVPRLSDVVPRATRRARGRRDYDQYARLLPGLICHGWQYCKKRKKYSTTAELLAAVAAFVAERLHVSQPAALILMLIFGRYLVGTFDDLCECR